MGEVGDVIGGTTAPFLSIIGSILVYLALKSQIEANSQIQNQFKTQQKDQQIDFEHNNFKSRIYLIIEEIDNFNIAFYDGTLISSVSQLHVKSAAKLNFSGIQSINLFLIEYFTDKTTKENKGNKQFSINDSFHAVYLNIQNLVILFYKTIVIIDNSNLPDINKRELNELLYYLYVSKFNFIIDIFLQNHLQDEFYLQLIFIKDYFKK